MAVEDDQIFGHILFSPAVVPGENQTVEGMGLAPMAVLPRRQRQGIGSMLMERFCMEVDACQATAYLETDLDKNVRFYERFGFKVVAESKIFDINNRYMSRAANT